MEPHDDLDKAAHASKNPHVGAGIFYMLLSFNKWRTRQDHIRIFICKPAFSELVLKQEQGIIKTILS